MTYRRYRPAKCKINLRSILPALCFMNPKCPNVCWPLSKQIFFLGGILVRHHHTWAHVSVCMWKPVNALKECIMSLKHSWPIRAPVMTSQLPYMATGVASALTPRMWKCIIWGITFFQEIRNGLDSTSAGCWCVRQSMMRRTLPPTRGRRQPRLGEDRESV